MANPCYFVKKRNDSLMCGLCNPVSFQRFALEWNNQIIIANKPKYETYRAGVVGAVGKISAFQLQGSRIDPRLSRDLNICASFFSA